MRLIRMSLACGLASVLAVPMASAASSTGTFGIAPARRHVLGEPGIALTPTEVINTTPDAYKVTVFPILLTQQLSGAFAFTTSSAQLADASQLLSVSPSSFLLGSHRELKVHLHWNALPPGEQQMTIGVVFQGMVANQSGPVLVVSRLLSVNFLRTAGATAVHGRFDGLRTTQFAREVLRITPRVANTGDRAWAPTGGSILIRNSLGQEVYRTTWSGDVVIPGAERDFPIDVTRLLAAGHYTVAARMRFGRAERVVGEFTLAGPNRLPTPDISVPYFNAAGSVGAPAKLATRIVSSGSAPASLAMRVTLEGTGGLALARHFSAGGVIRYGDLRPGAVRRSFQSLGGSLLPGAYSVTGTWTDAQGVPHTVESDFVAATSTSALSRFSSWLTGHLLIVLLVIGFGSALLTLRRRQIRLEAALAEARAGTPAGSSSDSAHR